MSWLKSSYTICRPFGIPVQIHWSFLAFLLWIGLTSSSSSSSPLYEVIFVSAIFLCVVLHEFGHALTARHFGIGTRDIVLYPMGGIASLTGESTAGQEFFIAIAGPLVNVLILFVLYPFLTSIDAINSQDISFIIEQFSFWDKLFFVNVVLIVFNMIPAFPMDGGRVLRSLLGLFLPMEKATLIAGRIGQLFCLPLGYYALVSDNVILAFIVILIFFSAGQEIAYYRQRAIMLRGLLDRTPPYKE